MARRGSSSSIWRISFLVALLLAAREALVDGARRERLGHLHKLQLLLQQGQEVHGVELGLSAMGSYRVERSLEEVVVGNTRDLDRVLEGEEDPRTGAFFGLEGAEVLSVEEDLAAGDLVARLSSQNVGERTLARAVRAHDGVDLARPQGEVDALQDRSVTCAGAQIPDLEDRRAHPTLPSRLTPSSFWASTANSMGSSRSTCLQKPFTIIEMASSSESPR
jgi:hypothetical protein